jgi:hypothetical protein
MPVAHACGIVRIPTASGVGMEKMRSGVSKLPMPKPETAAMAPARTDTAPRSQGEPR